VDETSVETLEEFTQIVSQRVADNPDIVVLLRGDTHAEIGRLIEVLGILNSLGITTSSIAANPAEE
jgi:biopolymer transport protein ExbD